MKKAILKFKTSSNEDSREFIEVKLYNEDGKFIWRLAGENGNECEVLPLNPKTVKQAKLDAKSVFKLDMDASWA